MENINTSASTTHVHTLEIYGQLIANVKCKLKAHDATQRTNTPQFRPSSTLELGTVNDQITEPRILKKICQTTVRQPLWDSERNHRQVPKLHPRNSSNRKDLTFFNTHGLCSNRDGRQLKTGMASPEIKQNVHKDKAIPLLEELQEIPEKGYKWDALNQLRAKFVQHFTK